MALVEQQPFEFLLQEEQSLSPPVTVPDDTNDFVSSPDYDNIKEEANYYQNPDSLSFTEEDLSFDPYSSVPSLNPTFGGQNQIQATKPISNGKGQSSKKGNANATYNVNNNNLNYGNLNLTHTVPVEAAQPVMNFMPSSSPDPDNKKSKITAKRAEQNRQAQKTFRERKMKYVKDLEEQLEQALKQNVEAELLKQENADLRNVILSLKQENDRLKTQRVPETNNFNFVWDPNASLNSLKNDKELKSGLSSDAFLSSSQSRTLSLDFAPPEFTSQKEDKLLDDFALPNPAGADWFLDPAIQAGEAQVGVPKKRNLEQAKIYSTPVSMLAPVLSKDEDANKDDMENQLCDLLKKIACKEKNPENFKGAKFVKKTS